MKKTATFIEKKTGISIPEVNDTLIETFLKKRCTILNMDIDRYLLFITSDIPEYNNLLNQVTISETYMFREEKQFIAVRDFILPELIKSGIKKIGIWSASCSTGSEAISLACVAEHFLKEHKGLSYSLLATDINNISLDIFKKGLLKKSHFRKDGESLHGLAESFLHEQGRSFHIDPKLLSNINIRTFNLFLDDYKTLPPEQHIVFLRNTFIYMPLPTRSLIISHILENMAPDGFLFLSASEIPLVTHPGLSPVQYNSCYFMQKSNKGLKNSTTVANERKTLCP